MDIDLVNEIFKLNNKLTESINVLAENGIKLAEAERDYKIKLRTEALKLRDEKNMPVTLIAQIIYGVPEVARLRFARDVAQATYEANQEYINATKLKIRILDSQISREFGNTGNGNM